MICLVALFVLFWGVVDLAGSSVGIMAARDSGASISVKTDEAMDAYFQKKILYDRLWDSLARIIVAGLIFGYNRWQANKLEA